MQAQTLVNGAITDDHRRPSPADAPRSDSGLRATDTYGNSILLTEAGNSTATANDGALNVTAGAVQFQVGANAGQTVTTSLGNIRTTNLGNTSVAGSNLSLDRCDDGDRREQRASRSPTKRSRRCRSCAPISARSRRTRWQSTIQYLGVGVENLQASDSQIRDTNVAQEVVNLTKNQIIQQAATSVLAQANSAPPAGPVAAAVAGGSWIMVKRGALWNLGSEGALSLLGPCYLSPG